MSKVLCPYCGMASYVEQEFELPGELDVMECPECERTFIFTTHVAYSYRSFSADCLNGGVHVYKKVMNEHDILEWRCSVCDCKKGE